MQHNEGYCDGYTSYAIVVIVILSTRCIKQLRTISGTGIQSSIVNTNYNLIVWNNTHTRTSCNTSESIGLFRSTIRTTMMESTQHHANSDAIDKKFISPNYNKQCGYNMSANDNQGVNLHVFNCCSDQVVSLQLIWCKISCTAHVKNNNTMYARCSIDAIGYIHTVHDVQ